MVFLVFSKMFRISIDCSAKIIKSLRNHNSLDALAGSFYNSGTEFTILKVFGKTVADHRCRRMENARNLPADPESTAGRLSVELPRAIGRPAVGYGSAGGFLRGMSLHNGVAWSHGYASVSLAAAAVRHLRTRSWLQTISLVPLNYKFSPCKL